MIILASWRTRACIRSDQSGGHRGRFTAEGGIRQACKQLLGSQVYFTHQPTQMGNYCRFGTQEMPWGIETYIPSYLQCSGCPAFSYLRAMVGSIHSCWPTAEIKMYKKVSSMYKLKKLKMNDWFSTATKLNKVKQVVVRLTQLHSCVQKLKERGNKDAGLWCVINPVHWDSRHVYWIDFQSLSWHWTSSLCAVYPIKAYIFEIRKMDLQCSNNE